MKQVSTDVVIIGGGAAGMLASAVAASRGLDVTIVESQPFCGKKLRITGKGRCNVTNNCDVKTFMQNVPRNGKFLYSALNALSPADTMELFESIGVRLKTERGSRVFPQSDNAHDVARALERYMKLNGVKLYEGRAEEITASNGAVASVKTENNEFLCKAAIICTGGMSYPMTGSTGDGFFFVKKLGHTVTELKPSLVPLNSPDSFCKDLQGLSLKNVTLSVYDDKGKTIFSELGEMLFAGFGITGPLVLSASSHLRGMEPSRYRFSIDLKPALGEEKLDTRLLRDFEKNVNKELKNALYGLAPRSLVPVLIERSGIDPETPVHSVTRQQRKALLSLFKNFTVNITGTRPIAEGVVTSGGVDVREIDPRTMQSKLVKGLYFAGEVLDVDAYTGGFNLQIAWSTGFTAGQSVCPQNEID